VVDSNIRSRDSFLPFVTPAIEDDDIQEVVATMKSGWLATGPKVARFENDFRGYKGASYAVAVSSCTAALHLSLLAAGVGPGDEVITSPMTFAATVNTIIHAGATPVLADVDSDTKNIDPDQVESKVTPKTRAIVPVHFAGRPCDMDALCAIVARYDLKLIEDCAHAIETEAKGQKAGTFGDFGCFSFGATKNLVTGEGGMVLTRREEDSARIKILALHGVDKGAWGRSGNKHYQVTEAGFKYNMMDLQAAIGVQQLQRVERYWQRRQEVWQRYNEAFADLPVGLPANSEPGTRHAYHLYTILIDEARVGLSRDSFLDAMTAQNIGVRVHYLSIPEHLYYQQSYGWQPEEYPHAMRLGRQTVSLPLSAGTLTNEDVEDVIRAVYKALDLE
jgi:dTDP-4-amino-4,6-dideoxygalactose transaminase